MNEWNLLQRIGLDLTIAIKLSTDKLQTEYLLEAKDLINKLKSQYTEKKEETLT